MKQYELSPLEKLLYLDSFTNKKQIEHFQDLLRYDWYLEYTGLEISQYKYRLVINNLFEDLTTEAFVRGYLGINF